MRLFLLTALILLASCGGPTKKAEVEKSKEVPSSVESVDLKIVVMEVAVDGMTCTGCEKTVETTVAALPGVKKVNASHTEKKVTIEAEAGALEVAQVTKAIEEAGYEIIKEE